MKKSEFQKAIRAYLKGKANSWQVFILEDYYSSFQHCFNILDPLLNEEVSEIEKRILEKINKKIDDSNKRA